MVQAHIHQGRVEVDDPIPAAWEGRAVKIVPLAPDDPIPDLDQRLAELHALGAMEHLPGEQQAIDQELLKLNRLSQQALADTDRASP
jgi:hypothetical protein